MMFAVRLLQRPNSVICRTNFATRWAGFTATASSKSAKLENECLENSPSLDVSSQAKPSSSKSNRKTSHIYQNLYPWKSELELAKLLASNVVYSENGLIAIVKPFGLGIYRSEQELISVKSGKYSNPNLELSRHILGQAKFCVHDVLDYLAQLLNVDQLHIVKSLHRDWSGLILLSANPKCMDQYKKATRRAMAALIPHLKFYCITNGIIAHSYNTHPIQEPDDKTSKPEIVQEDFIEERCGIRLLEIDQFGDVKEPIYVPPVKMSRNIRKHGMSSGRPEGMIKSVNARYRTLAINRKLAVSLVELQTSVTKWSFVQCFLAYKAAFVLGDTLFSNRVRHIAGRPVVIKPVKSVNQLEMIRNIDQRFEPLSEEVRRALGVRGNSHIPLMIYHSGVVLPGFSKSKKQKNNQINQSTNNSSSNKNSEFSIDANSLDNIPLYFRATLDTLGLNIFENTQQQQPQNNNGEEEEEVEAEKHSN